MKTYYIFDKYGYIVGRLFCESLEEAKYYFKRDWQKVAKGGHVEA